MELLGRVIEHEKRIICICLCQERSSPWNFKATRLLSLCKVMKIYEKRMGGNGIQQSTERPAMSV